MTRRKDSFGGRFDAGFKSFSEKIDKRTKKLDFSVEDNPFDFEPSDQKQISRIRFYNHDSMWNRWRRGYELYTLTQTVFGSKATGRGFRGDYRIYCTFQQYPGIFIPARLFAFPSVNMELGQQIVAIRDANSFNFYNFGLPIETVRYLQQVKAGTYSQTGTVITVSIADHGYAIGDSIYLNIGSGAAVSDTLTITATTTNTFTCTTAAAATAGGNLNTQRVTVFTDPQWVEQRVGLRYLPTPLSLFAGERLVDRVVEKDPGVTSTYTRVGSTVTVTCSAAHGLATGNEVYLDVSTGNVDSGIYEIVVLNSTEFTITTIESGSTSGNLTTFRRIRGFDYSNYVGYTVTGIDNNTNEIKFQRDDSYGARVFNPVTNQPDTQGVPRTITPAHRGFITGRYLTTEIRYQCTCQDYLKRETYNFYEEKRKRDFPNTAARSVRPGFRLDRNNNLINTRDDVGVYNSFGYVVVNNFYQLPTYEDSPEESGPLLAYYQLRWCKHIYAAMWSILHDEGNDRFDIASKYAQSGANITVTTDEPHNLQPNTRVHLEFTSGNVLSGDFLVSQVIDVNNFVIVYPIDQTTSGYCKVQNLKVHEYVDTWLLEPNDAPVGNSAELFYKKLEKESGTLRKELERLKMINFGTPWIGLKDTLGAGNQPTQVSNYDTNLVTMVATDSIKREGNELNLNGIAVNTTTTMLTIMQKMFNLDTRLIQSAKFGLLNQPLTDYSPDFQFGKIDGGNYLNGVPLDSNPEILDCGTYVNGAPTEAPFTVVDCGVYA
jgi:hypothetical protein